MAYPTSDQITKITDVSPGILAQILFSKGFTSVMNKSYKEYQNVLMPLRQKQASTEREYRFLIKQALGMNAVKYQVQGQSNVAFPQGDITTPEEVVAVMKKLQVTVEIDRNVWNRIKLAQNKYVDNPLAMEIADKMDVAKISETRSLFGDGSGALGIIGSVAAASNKLVVTLSSADSAIGGGNTNWFFKGEHIAFCDAAGAADTLTNHATVVKYRVESTDRKNRKVVLTGLTSADASVNITDVTGLAAGSRIYPIANLDSAFVGPDVSGACDWGKVSPVWAGLESLTANDGRTVFGMTMSGMLAGSRFDHGGVLFDTSAIEEAFNETEQNVGPGKYSWNQLLMPYNAYSALLEGKEADRRFNSVEDSARGGRKFIYQYGDLALDCVKSQFCPFNRIYSIPAPAAGEFGETGYALEYRGTDFQNVNVGNSQEFLKVASGGGYTNMLQSFLEAYTVMIPKQPAAVTCITNFQMV